MAAARQLSVAGLNDEQCAAATADATIPLLILAGAGSGKTKTMVRRCVFFVATGVCKLEEILALTFTKGAAMEMDERLRRELRIGTSSKGPTVCTFHKIALDICRAHIKGPGFTRNFTVWTAAEQRDVVIDFIRARHGKDNLEPKAIFRIAGRVQRALALRRSMAWDGDACEQTLRDGDKALLDDLHDHYEATLRRCNALDIAGFVLKAIELLEADRALRRRWRARFPVLLVDEFQDTSRAQLMLLTLLAQGPAPRASGGVEGGAAPPPPKQVRSSVTVVGDENQSIYAFSGASVRNFALFEHTFSPIRIVTLRRNYRSSANVVQIAEAVVHPLAQKSRFAAAAAAWTSRARGAPVRVREARSPAAEMMMLVAMLRARRGERGATAQRKWAESAVMFRTNAVGVEVEEALRAACIPFARAGRSGVDEAQRGDVQNFLSLLRFLVSPRDDVAFRRVIERVLRVRLAPSALELVRRTARALEGSLCDAARAICAAPCKTKSPPPPMRPPQPSVLQPLPVARKRARQRGAFLCPHPNAAPHHEEPAAGAMKKQQAAAATAPPPPSHAWKKRSSGARGAAVVPLSKAERRDLAAAIAQIDTLRTRMTQLTLQCFVQRCVQHFPRLVASGAVPSAASASAAGPQGGGAAPTFASALLSEARAFAGGRRGAASAAPLAAAAVRERFARFVEHITLAIDGAAFGRAATGAAAARATPRESRDAVWIGTVHQAKGLEWPFTAVVRMNEGVFPLRDMRPGAPLPSARRTAEERRLCYVAFSRARHELAVSYVALSAKQQAPLSSFVTHQRVRSLTVRTPGAAGDEAGGRNGGARGETAEEDPAAREGNGRGGSSATASEADGRAKEQAPAMGAVNAAPRPLQLQQWVANPTGGSLH